MVGPPVEPKVQLAVFFMAFIERRYKMDQSDIIKLVIGAVVIAVIYIVANIIRDKMREKGK